MAAAVDSIRPRPAGFLTAVIPDLRAIPPPWLLGSGMLFALIQGRCQSRIGCPESGHVLTVTPACLALRFTRMFRFAVAGLLLAILVPVVPLGMADEPVQRVQLEVFVRSDKASTDDVDRYLKELQQRTAGLQVFIRDVISDREQLARLYELTRQTARDKPVVPAFHTCGRLFFGFESAAQTGPAIENLLAADVYTRSTCPRCQQAKAFLARLQQRWPAIRFNYRDVSLDTAARARWQALCAASGSTPGLPTFDFGGQVIIGYQGDGSTGRQYEDLISSKATLVPEPADASPPAAPAPAGRSSRWGASRFIPVAIVNVLPIDPSPGDSDPPDSEGQAYQSDAETKDLAELGDLDLPEEADESDLGEAEMVPSSASPSEHPEAIEVPLLGRLRVSELGMPLFTFLVGLVDGFNPCAMWVLVFLLSVLVNIKDRRKILLIAGTFVVVSGLAYFAFMAAWLNLFLLIGIVRPVQIVLGLMAVFIGMVNVKDFFAFHQGLTLSIPESAKPGLYKRVREIVSAKYLTAALAGVVALAVVVNMVELLCTAGLPALYTQVLTMQAFPAWKNYLFLGLYISAYMLDDAVLLGIVVATLSHRKLQEREGRWLKLLSGVVILLLGLVMLFRPTWLQLGQ